MTVTLLQECHCQWESRSSRKMSPTLLVFIILAVGSSLAASVEKPKQAAGGEVEAQGDTLTPLGVADAAKAVESEEVSLLASVSIHHIMYYRQCIS